MRKSGTGRADDMLNPLSLPAELLDALRAIASIERLLDERLATLDERLRGLDLRMKRLPTELERTVRPHFDAQREGIAALLPELVANREHAEKLPGLIEGLRGELRGVLAEISEVRETVEPLQGPAERVARLNERLPGGG